jgi:small subunit ribosomal protein S1
MRHLEKEDKSKARQGETLDFKVIEFSKENKKIIVSHTRVFQDNIETERQKSENEEAKKERATKKTVKKINETLEKTTLGDLSVLASLKEEIEKEQKGE